MKTFKDFLIICVLISFLIICGKSFYHCGDSVVAFEYDPQDPDLECYILRKAP